MLAYPNYKKHFRLQELDIHREQILHIRLCEGDLAELRFCRETTRLQASGGKLENMFLL